MVERLAVRDSRILPDREDVRTLLSDRMRVLATIATFLGDEALRRRFSAAARRNALQRFSIERMVAEYAAICEEIVGSGQQAVGRKRRREVGPLH